MNDEEFAATVESTLGFSDGPIDELRERVLRAMRYTFSWSEAVGSGTSGVFTVLDIAAGNESPVAAALWQSRISEMQDALRALLVMMPLSDVFPGKDTKAAYDRVSAGFAQLYRDLALSRDTLPRPDLLDKLGELGKAALKAPVAAVTTLAEELSQSIAQLLGGTTAAIWSALWPWLLLAGAAGTVYVFRAPLGRLVGKVSA